MLGDTWEWDGLTWSQVASTGPTPRYFHAMAYDSQRGRSVLFGGSGITVAFFGDTWEWDGSTWVQVSASGPSARYLPALVFDSLRGRTVLFGGVNSTNGHLGDAWEWSGSYVSTAAAYGNGCGLALSPIARPTINTTAQASLTNIPSTLAFVAIGWSRTSFGPHPFPLPLSLASYGMPGCELLQSADAAAQPVTFTGPGSAMFSLALPNWAGLIGLDLYLQGWAYAPGANAGNAIVSNGIEWGIGNS